MRRTALASLVLTAALAAAGPAAAVNCYEVLDRSENVIYRGTLPPVDLSDKGAPEREAMRKRGQHLIAMDVERCLGVEYFTGAAGSTSLSVDQIVGGIAPPARGAIAATPTGNSAPPAPAAARPTP